LVAAPNPTETGAIPFAPLSAQAASAIIGPVPEPSALSAVEPTVLALRTAPARLQHLTEYLLRESAADRPAKLNDVHAAVQNMYTGKTKNWWTQMLQEAEEKGLIELIDMDDRPKKRKIRLLERGSFVYV
jgi:hypothetical protein